MISLVTGGGGFIGAHLVRRLRDGGDRVRVLDREVPDERAEGVDYVRGSVTDPAAVRQVVRGADRVFHLAALSALWVPDKREFIEVNHLGTRIVLRTARDLGARRIVHCSTEAVLRTSRGAYCRAKRLAEEEAMVAAARGLPVVVVNPTIPIGPGDRRLTPPARMLLGFLRGEHQAYLESTLDLVDVRDAAEGHIAAAERGVAGERYLLGGERVRLSELLALLEELSGVEMPRRRVPYWLALAAAALSELAADRITGRAPAAPLTGVRLARAPLRAGGVRRKEELGLRSRPLRESLADAVRDFERRGLIAAPRHDGFRASERSAR